METNITDTEIAAAFEGTNFGGANHRRLLEQGVLKRLTGYHCGHTLTMIMRDLGLTTEKDNATKKGKLFAMGAFYQLARTGDVDGSKR
jgi:hypothetical protein